jgi:hypothetical protein
VSKEEISSELKKPCSAERSDETADSIAYARSEGLARGAVKPKQHAEVFRNARRDLVKARRQQD